MTKTFHLLPPTEAASWRAGNTNEGGARPYRSTASGRARCRSCGEKIAKGETVIVNWYSFTNQGSMAACNCYLHLNCAPNV